MRSLKGILEDLRKESDDYFKFNPESREDSDGHDRDSVAYGIERAIDVVKRGYVSDAEGNCEGYKTEDLLEINLQFTGAEVEEITEYIEQYYSGNSKAELTQFLRTAILDNFRKGYDWAVIRKLSKGLFDLGNRLLELSIKTGTWNSDIDKARKQLLREGFRIYDNPLRNAVNTNNETAVMLQKASSNCTEAAMIIIKRIEEKKTQAHLLPASIDSEFEEDDFFSEDNDEEYENQYYSEAVCYRSPL